MTAADVEKVQRAMRPPRCHEGELLIRNPRTYRALQDYRRARALGLIDAPQTTTVPGDPGLAYDLRAEIFGAERARQAALVARRQRPARDWRDQKTEADLLAAADTYSATEMLAGRW